MDIKDKYKLVLKRAIDNNNNDILKYESNLYYRLQYLKNICISQNIFSYLLHPIKLYRTKNILKKYTDYYEQFNNLKDEKLEDIMIKVSDDLETNYCYAAVHLKIEKLENFIKTHQMESEKKLLKIRK